MQDNAVEQMSEHMYFLQLLGLKYLIVTTYQGIYVFILVSSWFVENATVKTLNVNVSKAVIVDREFL